MSASNQQSEAIRQLSICNSCRYCEGYCATFQALTRHRSFDIKTVSHLSNLCHNCRGCYYACQYTEPHEFALNIPSVLAGVRAQNWEDNIQPRVLSKLMQRSIWPYVVIFIVFLLLLSVGAGVPWMSAQAFYSAMSHTLMVSIFLPLFLLPLIFLSLGLRRYWQSIDGSNLTFADFKEALASAATMKQLSGGQGQGCNYESGERYTSHRRWAHQAVMFGFLLCLLSTSVATLYHYVLDYPAPYPIWILPKLFGVIGGLLLCAGCLAMWMLKSRADNTLGSTQHLAGEYAFIGLLFLVSVTGLLLYWSKGTPLAGTWLIVHLAFVATFFVSLPYSKMTHGFFRLASLCREAQIKRQLPS
ncbi:MAG: tricarballylate utilization 4Fe-4S protein TcuB [Pseudomonadota bacterium]